jgi:hypothetical protein
MSTGYLPITRFGIERGDRTSQLRVEPRVSFFLRSTHYQDCQIQNVVIDQIVVTSQRFEDSTSIREFLQKIPKTAESSDWTNRLRLSARATFQAVRLNPINAVLERASV